jgi:hypothetical protein
LLPALAWLFRVFKSAPALAPEAEGPGEGPARGQDAVVRYPSSHGRGTRGAHGAGETDA